MMSTRQGALPPPPGVVANLDNPQDVLRTVNFVVQGMCLAIASAFVFLRMYTRWFIQKSMFKEDWVCLSAWIFFVGYMVDNIMYGFYGGGYNIWEVTMEDVKKYLENYPGLLLYGPTACLIKLTLILFSARLFATAHKSTIAIKIFVTVMLGYYIPIQFARVFICNPIAAYWDRASYPHSTCLDMRAFYLADTVMSTTTDLAVLIIPIPLVWGAKLSKGKKMRVVGILAAGGLANVASIARLVFVRHIWATHNGTLYGVAFNILGVAETSIGLICACLPSLSIFLDHNSEKMSKRSKSSEPDVDVGKGGSSPRKPSNADNSTRQWEIRQVIE